MWKRNERPDTSDCAASDRNPFFNYFPCVMRCKPLDEHASNI